MELGAGTGFSASVLLSMQPMKIVCTDYDPKSLECLHYNMNVNSNRFRKILDAKKSTFIAKVHVDLLDWTKYDIKTLVAWNPDFIIGSDLTYSPDLHEPLASLIQDCLVHTRAERVFLVCPNRNDDTFKNFIECIQRRKSLSYSYLSPPMQAFKRSGKADGFDPKILEIR